MHVRIFTVFYSTVLSDAALFLDLSLVVAVGWATSLRPGIFLQAKKSFFTIMCNKCEGEIGFR